MSCDPYKRLRFGTTKTKTGCVTCKKRRIKCDEARPFCGCCSKSRRECVWQAQEAGTKVIYYQRNPASTLCSSPDLTYKDRQAFEYFISNTLCQMLGTWRVPSWLSMILQRATAEPAIQRAGIALGALHEHRITGRNHGRHYALSQYVKAIRMVSNAISWQQQASQEMLLLACILFCAFETMSWHLDSAISHLSSGLSLILQHASTVEPAPHHSSLKSFLLPVFAQLDNDRMLLGALSPCGSYPGDDIILEMPTTFQSVYEAQEMLIRVINVSIRYMATPYLVERPELFAERAQKIAQWGAAFDMWLPEYLAYAPDEDISSLLVLFMWRSTSKLVLEADFEQGEMVWDAMYNEFETVIECGERFMELTGQPADADWTFPPDESNQPPSVLPQHGSTVHPEVPVKKKLMINSQTTTYGPVSPFERASTASTNAAASVANLLRRAEALRRSTTPSARRDAQPSFMLSHGIVYPLYAITARCRDPHLRRRGLSILESCNRQEGLWDSRGVGRLCRRIMLVEEKLAAQEMALWGQRNDLTTIEHAAQIPNHCRVRASRRVVLPDGNIVERFCLGWKSAVEEVRAKSEMENWVEIAM